MTSNQMEQTEISNQSKTLKLGIVGNPLSHTRSPQMQSAGLSQLGVNGSYEKFEISEEKFSDEFPKLLGELDGVNVTIPYKEEILRYLNKTDPLVERIGAANTIHIHDGLIAGSNTDYYGFKRSLGDLDLRDKKVSILGAGGAAKAVIIALEDMGVADIDVYVRNKRKALKSLPDMEHLINIHLRNFDTEIDFSESSLLVNCTPIGQGRLAHEIPIEPNELKYMSMGATVFDLIYTDTLLLKAAREMGCKTIDGSEMLIQQGVKSLSIWTGQEITDELVQAMRDGFNTIQG